MDDLVPAGNEGRMTRIPECNTICQPSIHQADLKCYSININIKALTLLWIFNVFFYCNCILKRCCMSLLPVLVKGWTFSPSYLWQIYKILLHYSCGRLMLIFKKKQGEKIYLANNLSKMLKDFQELTLW